MREVERVATLLRESVLGPAWHGDSLLKVLKDVSAEGDLQSAGGGVHSVWEILQHVAVWERVVRQRLLGRDPGPVPDSEDWPDVEWKGSESWEPALERLREETDRLSDTILQMPEARLLEEAPGQHVTNYQMIHGIIHHNIYHAGQIALLRKLQSGRTEISEA